MLTENEILDIFKEKYKNGDFRIIGNDKQQSKTIEIQNAHFEVSRCWIVRPPVNDYFLKELEWYDSLSLNVNDIPGGAPSMWKMCATEDGFINSNYGWCIYSYENGRQFDNCAKHLIDDPHTREAIMIYNRPSMQQEYNKNGMHDFMCCQNVQYFINEIDDQFDSLDCIVNFRSNDAVFGYNNDAAWVKTVSERLTDMLNNVWKGKYGKTVKPGHIYWNAGSLHIYERHFKFLNNE